MNEDEFSKNADSDESIDDSYFQVNPMTVSTTSESVNLVPTDQIPFFESGEKTHVEDGLINSNLSSLISDPPSLRRNDSLSSTTSSIVFAAEDFPSIENHAHNVELRETLSNLDINMLRNMSSSFVSPSAKQIKLAALSKSLSQGDATRYLIQSTIQDSPNEKILEFQFNKSPDAKELSYIIIFLGNRSKSGGGVILKASELDKTNNVLTIEFKSSETKRRLLKEASLSFRDYRLFINEPIKKESFSLDRSTMILCNVNEDEDLEVLYMLAENLVADEISDEDSVGEDDIDAQISPIDESPQKQRHDSSSGENEIAEKSVIFPRTYLVKFKRDFDMSLARERLEECAFLNGSKIELVDAYVTNIVLIRDSEFQPLKTRIDSITRYLAERCQPKSRSNAFTVRLIEPFLLVRFRNPSVITSILQKKEHMVDDRAYFFEYFSNYDLLMEEINRIGESGINVAIRDAQPSTASQPAQEQPTSDLAKSSISPLESKERDVMNNSTIYINPTSSILQDLASEKAVESDQIKKQSAEAEEPSDASAVPEQPERPENELVNQTITNEASPVKQEQRPLEDETEIRIISTDPPITHQRTPKLERPFIDISSNVDPRIKVVIYWNDLYLQKFMTSLSNLDPEIVFNPHEESYRIQCTYNLPNNRFDSQTWIAVVKTQVDDFLKDFEYFKMALSLLKGIDSENLAKKISYENTKVRVVFSPKSDSIEVYGLKESVEDYVAELFVVIRQVQAEANVAIDQSKQAEPSHENSSSSPSPPSSLHSSPKQANISSCQSDESDIIVENVDERIEEKITGLPIHQIRVLYVEKYKNQVNDKFGKAVKVTLSPAQGLLELEGKRSNVYEAKRMALNIIQNITTQVLDEKEISRDRILFVSKKEIHFVHWQREKGIRCAVVPEKNSLMLNAFKKEQIDKCIEAMKKDITSIPIDCSILNKDLDDFEAYLLQIESNSDNPFVIVKQRNSTKINIVGLKESVDQVYKDIFQRFVY